MAGSNDSNDVASATRASGLEKTELPPRAKLPPNLQKMMDDRVDDESLYDELWGGTARESTDSNIRYAAYATRIRTALVSAQRYVAYTSDIGESFRHVAHRKWVKAAYGVSGAYLLGDVAHEGYKAYRANRKVRRPDLPSEAMKERYADARQEVVPIVAKEGENGLVHEGRVSPLEDYRIVMVQRGIFQAIASLGLPALTIHSIVRYSGRAMKDVKNVRLRTLGPIGLGLATVPALPYMFDEPVEKVVEWVFHAGFEYFGGPKAVGAAPSTGREKELQEINRTEF